MILDQGPVKIYAVENKNVGGVPVPSLTFLCAAFYGELSVGMEEHYTAAAHSKALLGRIRVWQNKQIKPNQVVVDSDGTIFEIERVIQGVDDSARYNRTRQGSLLPITDIVLKPPSRTYDVPEVKR